MCVAGRPVDLGMDDGRREGMKYFFGQWDGSPPDKQ